MKPEFPERTSKLRLSTHRIQTYLECGERYRRMQIEPRRHVSIPLLIGTGIHSAASRHHELQIQGLPEEDLSDVAAEAYDAEIQESERVVADGKDATPKDIGRGKDLSVRGAGAWQSQIAPGYRAIMSEEPVVTDVGDIELSGVLDCVTDDGVRDLKTSSRKWSIQRAQSSIQMSIYHVLHRSRVGTWPKTIAIDNLWHTQKWGWQSQRIDTHRDTGDLDALARLLKMVASGIEKGHYPPAQPDSWRCSARYCEYWWDCPYVSDRRRIGG